MQDFSIQESDKQHLMANIFAAMDNVVWNTAPENKIIISSIENIIQNIAELDFARWAQLAQNEVGQRLTCNDERIQTSGLRSLKSLIQAFESEIDETRKPLDGLVNTFFPILEQILGQDGFMNSSNYVPMVTLMCKIFFMSNQVSKGGP